MAAAWRAIALVLVWGCSFHSHERTTDGGPDGAAPRDATDAATDAPPPVAAFAVSAVTAGNNVSSLTYPLSIPAGTDRFLVVTVQLGTDCFGTVPSIASVTYAGQALTQIATIVGTPCGTGTTRSDQWGLVAPPTGTNNVVVTLGGTATSAHSGALAFTGIDQTNPVRMSASAKGTGSSSTVSVASAVGDLVVNTVGQGTSVTAPGAGQTVRFLHNVDSSNTLNNSAASTAAGAAMVTMTWTFGAVDEWQTISSSLRP